ncbi:hypothetical protein [Rhodocyclus tenuis]|uniref:Uncharacterized protein n=1 Tax=Rhodocyclus tenuis TaxID=1066 RepID=A0A840G078_RHOTE|nr:hypothetical protein [Rhodocyclus tenuis]MBB4247797.1 hypothetical protein [Rhodocyclus tenuis]MBK1681068.1 hypothetical protein [Rhodocyclus tenuis]
MSAESRTTAAATPSGNEDRRRNLRLRATFDSAVLMIEPFFDNRQGWGGASLEHMAFHVLRENYPELEAEEVHALIVAARRVFAERGHSGEQALGLPGA